MPAIVALLEAAHLPAVELELHLANVVVAEVDGRVVGCGGVEIYPDCDACLIRSMAVEEPLQGTGLGGRILTWVMERARERGANQLFLFTVNARDFYAHYGFQDVTLDDFPECARGSVQYRAVQRFQEEWGVFAMARR